jgi:hypothetical protein
MQQGTAAVLGSAAEQLVALAETGLHLGGCVACELGDAEAGANEVDDDAGLGGGEEGGGEVADGEGFEEFGEGVAGGPAAC